MKKVIVKENNGGGLSIELYIDGEINQVVTGLEFGEPLPISDIIGFGDTWDSRDASQGYDMDTNTTGERDEEGNLITADKMIDYSDWTKEIAVYDESTGVLTLAVDEAGNAGNKLLGII
jgi:hypothetical protein